MIFKNKKSQKFISGILIILILLPAVLFSPPKKAEATIADWIGGASQVISTIWKGIQWAYEKSGISASITTAGTAVKTWYKELYKEILMAIARKALQEVTKSIVNWINTGFHGSPLFLENPESFFRDIAKSEVKNIVDMFGYDNLKYPFGKDFALNTINSYKQTLENNTAYSLSKVMTDPAQLRNYQNNFDYGGWNAFLVNTQYPQNNYLGFQMLATEELARRVQGTTQTAAQKVQTALQQGQGFLSPEKCMDEGTTYNDTMANAWQRPSFNQAEFNKNNKYTCNDDFPNDDNGWKACNDAWKEKLETEKNKWAKDNTCKNLVTTTPGAVVADQIKINLGSSVRQQELAAAMGNSLSAIFDALINKFIGDGLNSLTSDKNSKLVEDTWSYDGLTLGSPTEGGTNSSWDSGPDEEIILDKFKKQLHGKTIVTKINPETGAEETTEEIGNTGNGTYIPGDIANTEIEIILISEMPKLINNLDKTNPGIMQLTEVLDQCIPGPDKSWEVRLGEEQQRVSKILSEDQSSDDPLKVKASNETIRELKFAVDSFREWLTDRMMEELPNSILYIDVIKGIDNLSEELQDAANTKRTKYQALARLKAIAGDEKATVKTGLASISVQPEPGSTEERTMVALKRQYNSIQSSISNSFTIEEARSKIDALRDKKNNTRSMITECTAARVVAGWEEIGKDTSKQNGISEIEKFCKIPIVSGYSHGVVIRNDQASRLTNCPANPGGCGRVVDGISTFDTTGWFSFRNPNIDPTIPTGDGTFEPQPADMGNPGFEDLAMVNARNVYGDDDKISIEIDCNLIFKANKTNYTQAGESSI